MLKIAAGLVVAVIIGSSAATPALANCYYAGKAYSTGARIPVQECQADGSWQQK